MCRFRLWLLYWVSTQMRWIPPLTRLDSAKSTTRYRPPNGTADLARSAVSGPSRRPTPPARTTPRIRCRVIPLSPWVLIPSRGRRRLFQAVDQLLVQLPEPFRQVPVEGLEVV